jgi:hypothetical protein
MAPPLSLSDALPHRVSWTGTGGPPGRPARLLTARGDACVPRRASCARSVLAEHDASWKSTTPVSRCPPRHPPRSLSRCAMQSRATRSACGRSAAPALTSGIRRLGQSPPSRRRPHLPLVTIPVPNNPMAASRFKRLRRLASFPPAVGNCIDPNRAAPATTAVNSCGTCPEGIWRPAPAFWSSARAPAGRHGCLPPCAGQPVSALIWPPAPPIPTRTAPATPNSCDRICAVKRLSCGGRRRMHRLAVAAASQPPAALAASLPSTRALTMPSISCTCTGGLK